jgi:hypothetical protein
MLPSIGRKLQMFENDECLVVNINLDDPMPFAPLQAEQAAFTLPQNTGLLLNIDGAMAIQDGFWAQLSANLDSMLPTTFKQFFIQVDSGANIPPEFFRHPRFQTLLNIGVLATLDASSWQALLTTAFQNPALYAFTYEGKLDAEQFEQLLNKLSQQSSPALKQLTLNHADVSSTQAIRLVAQTAPLQLELLNLAWNPIRAGETQTSLIDFQKFAESLFDGTMKMLHLASVTDQEALILSRTLAILTRKFHLSIGAIGGLTEVGLENFLATAQYNASIQISVEDLDSKLAHSTVNTHLQTQSTKNNIPSLFWQTLRTITRDPALFLPHMNSFSLSLLPAKNFTQYLHMKRLEAQRDEKLAGLQPTSSNSHCVTDEAPADAQQIHEDYENELIACWHSFKLS